MCEQLHKHSSDRYKVWPILLGVTCNVLQAAGLLAQLFNNSCTAPFLNTAVASLALTLSALMKTVYASNSLMESLSVYNILSGFCFSAQTLYASPPHPPLLQKTLNLSSLHRMRWVTHRSPQTVLTNETILEESKNDLFRNI